MQNRHRPELVVTNYGQPGWGRGSSSLSVEDGDHIAARELFHDPKVDLFLVRVRTLWLGVLFLSSR